MLTIQQTFIELILYVIFLSVLYLVSYSNRDARWYNVVQHLNHQLIASTNVSSGDTTIRFNEVTSTSSFYEWLKETTIPFVFPRYSASGDQLSAYHRLYLQDQASFRVGPMRVRQVRALQEPCRKELWDNSTCFDEYSIMREDDADYCVGWEPGPCIRGQAVYNMTSEAWKFVSSFDVWGLPVTGQHAIYSGGGYISEFLVNYNISQSILDDLYKYVWIDRKTRAVFTEFTLYNVDNNVFVFISLLCEFTEIGGVISTPSIKPFRPYQHVGDMGLFIFICEIIVLIGLIIFAVKKCLSLYHQGRKELRELWNCLDFLIIIIFFICTIMYIGRWVMINRAMEKFENNKNKFVNFSHISWWDELFNTFLAFDIFLTTFRLMRVLNYNSRMRQLGNVLHYVSKDLMGCFLMFLIVYTAFITFGHLVFGRQLETYRNLFVSSTTLTNAIIGKNSINDLFSVEPVLGRAYYFFFVLFLLWILMTMLNATLNVGITTVRNRGLKATYGIINILTNLWTETIGMFFSFNGSKTTKGDNKKEDDISDIILGKDVPKQFELLKPSGSNSKLELIKPMEANTKVVRRKFIYQ